MTPSAPSPPSGARIYLVRHARPSLPGNLPHFVGGSSDPPLSRIGIAQAEKLATRLADVDFHEVWSTGLERTTHTAAIVGRRPPENVSVERDLREVELGLWEGLRAQEAAERYPEDWAAREADIVGFQFPGGESFRELRDRVVPAFSRLASETAATTAGNTLVVAHKNVNRILLCEALGLPLESMFSVPQDHCAVSILRVEMHAGRPRVQVEEGLG